MLVEGFLQLADLLGGELGPQASLLMGRVPLAVLLPHLALGPRSVTAAVWERQNRMNE